MNVKEAIRQVREAELFQDGCEADLHEAGIKTLPDAYMQGRLDALTELELILGGGT